MTVVLVSVALLCGLGVVMVYSASAVTSVRTQGNSWAIVARQIMWLCLGVVAAYGAYRVHWRIWRDRIALPMMLVAIGSLGYVALGVLFQKATGLTGMMRRTLPEAPGATAHHAPVLRVEPSVAPAAAAPVQRAAPRPAQQDDMGLEIPTFLRRQSNN